MSDTETRQAVNTGTQTTPTTNVVVEADRKLKRELSALDLLGLSMGGIIGSGWLFAVNAAAAVAGPSVILSWIIGGILVLFVALVYAEISGMLPRSGAIVRYPHYTHGSYTGYIMGWAYLLSSVTVPTIEAEAVVGYGIIYTCPHPECEHSFRDGYGAITSGHSVRVRSTSNILLPELRWDKSSREDQYRCNNMENSDTRTHIHIPVCDIR